MKALTFHITVFTLLTLSIDHRLPDFQIKQDVSLKDGTMVRILKSTNVPSEYYFLPLNLQISENKGVPEISLMIYQNDRNQITGGILHVLMTWGLSPQQQKEAQEILVATVDSLGSLKGPVDITFESGELEFDERDIFARALKNSSSSTIKIPTLPMHKTAASFKLSPLLARFIVEEMNSIHQSDQVKMKALYHYTAISGDGRKRAPIEVKGEMHTSLASWIKALRKYKLIKIVQL